MLDHLKHEVAAIVDGAAVPLPAVADRDHEHIALKRRRRDHLTRRVQSVTHDSRGDLVLRFLVGLVGIVDLLQVVVPDDVSRSVLVDKLLELRVKNAIDRLQSAVHG